jgi:hypothetical protein
MMIHVMMIHVMMIQWQEIIVIANAISFTGSEDQLIWQYESNGVYSSQSMYALVNIRGVRPVYLPAVWKLNIPPRYRCSFGFSLKTK